MDYIERVKAGQELAWINRYHLPFDMTKAVCELVVSDEDILDAEERLLRFAPFIRKCFPETEATEGLIESPLEEIPIMQKKLHETYNCQIPGKLFLKMDSHLAIAGSVKARGGIYEVLKHAEELVLEAGLLTKEDSYEKFAEPQIRGFLKKYTMQVGSTGNLGMSIGIMSAALGFQVKIHMSQEAKQWKKDLLRSKGVEVLEYEDDYSKAVAEGRKASDEDPYSYFVDDEKSKDLFVGYVTAAKRLQEQLKQKNIKIDQKHPLIVYIPAGVGGAPGGITYGLKRIFGDQVHCFFAETTTCPSVLLGIETQLFEKANVRDFGISGMTDADGLACASPSGFVTRLMSNLVSGEFTICDQKLYEHLKLLYTTEDIKIEPSSCAAFAGPCGLLHYQESMDYCAANGLTAENLNNAVQIVWATGGSMIPEEIYRDFLTKGA